MLVLRSSNIQGATIRLIVPRHKNSIVFIVQHQKFKHVHSQLSVNYLLNFQNESLVELGVLYYFLKNISLKGRVLKVCFNPAPV